MGSMAEEPEYAGECIALAEALGIPAESFTGDINIREYLGRMDFTILTSISEGQPLAVLESFAAGKPVIATDVGDCRGLIYGEGRDSLGAAGILTHIMNQEEIAAAIVELALHPEEREAMGKRGKQRVKAVHELSDMRRTYRELYQGFAERMGLTWTEQPFEIGEVR